MHCKQMLQIWYYPKIVIGVLGYWGILGGIFWGIFILFIYLFIYLFFFGGGGLFFGYMYTSQSSTATVFPLLNLNPYIPKRARKLQNF